MHVTCSDNMMTQGVGLESDLDGSARPRRDASFQRLNDKDGKMDNESRIDGCKNLSRCASWAVSNNHAG